MFHMDKVTIYQYLFDYHKNKFQRFRTKEEAEKAESKIKNDLGLYCFTEKI